MTIVAVGAGLAYSGLGPTHHACEDIAFLRSIPNMVVVCPGDAFEVRGALRAALQQDRPVYIRMGKKGEPVVHKGPIADFAIGKAITISEGSDVCLLSTGNMLPEAIEAAHRLKDKGISAAGRQLPYREAARRGLPARTPSRRFRLVATIEEHSLIGGFGAAVSEWLVDTETPHQKFLRFGTPDSFLQKIRRAGICPRGARPDRAPDRRKNPPRIALRSRPDENRSRPARPNRQAPGSGGNRNSRAEARPGAGRNRLFRRLRHPGDGVARRQGRGQMGAALPRP